MSFLNNLLGFNNANDEFKNFASQYDTRADKFEDLDSEWYQKNKADFSNFLGKQISRAIPTLDTILASAKASGVNGYAAGNIANQHLKRMNSEAMEATSQGTLAYSNDLAKTGLGYAATNRGLSAQMMGQYGEGQRQAQKNKTGFLNSLIGAGASLGGAALAQKGAKEAADSAFAQQQAMFEQLFGSTRSAPQQNMGQSNTSNPFVFGDSGMASNLIFGKGKAPWYLGGN